MLHAVFALLVAVVMIAARVLYRQAGGFTPGRFPRTAAAIGPFEPRLGAVRGAVEGVPVAVRIIDAAAADAVRDEVVVTSPAPGAATELVLRGVAREVPPDASAPRLDEFARAFVAEGHAREELDALLPVDVRESLLLLASPDPNAPTTASSKTSAPGYRDDGRGHDKGTAPARNVSLVVRGGQVELRFETRRVTDAQLMAAVSAVTRTARRAMNRPFEPEALSMSVLRSLVIGAGLGLWGVAMLMGGSFVGGVRGTASDRVFFDRRAFVQRYSISVRDERDRRNVLMSVSDDALRACPRSLVEREPWSLTYRCDGARFTDLTPVFGAAALFAGVALAATSWISRKRTSSVW